MNEASSKSVLLENNGQLKKENQKRKYNETTCVSEDDLVIDGSKINALTEENRNDFHRDLANILEKYQLSIKKKPIGIETEATSSKRVKLDEAVPLSKPKAAAVRKNMLVKDEKATENKENVTHSEKNETSQSSDNVLIPEINEVVQEVLSDSIPEQLESTKKPVEKIVKKPVPLNSDQIHKWLVYIAKYQQEKRPDDIKLHELIQSYIQPKPKPEIFDISDDENESKSNEKETGITDSKDIIQFLNISGHPDTLKICDLLCLRREKYLNDKLINWMITDVMKKLDKNVQDGVSIIDTYLLPRITSNFKGWFGKHEVDFFLRQKMKLNCLKEKQQFLELFGKLMIVFPIFWPASRTNENAHWMIAFVIQPKSLIKKRKQKCHIYFFDSAPSKAFDPIRQAHMRCVILTYLNTQYLLSGRKGKFNSTGVKITALSDRPKQRSGFDCGLFIAHYFQKMMGSIRLILTMEKPECLKWGAISSTNNNREILNNPRKGVIKRIMSQANGSAQKDFANYCKSHNYSYLYSNESLE